MNLYRLLWLDIFVCSSTDFTEATATLTLWLGFSILMNLSSYTDWNNRSSMSYHSRHVFWRAVILKAANPRFESEVTLLTVQKCNCDAPFRKRRMCLEKVDPKITHCIIPRMSVSGIKISTKTVLTQKLPSKMSCEIALSGCLLFTQLTNANSRLISFPGTLRETLQQCGQPGIANRPHTSNSTEGWWLV